MVASANFTANGSSVPPELAVAASSLVTLSLLSASGVDTVAWSIIGNHAASAVNPTITPAGTPLGKTATFTMPAGAGQAYLIQCQINGGVDSEGVEQVSYTKTAIVGVNAIATGAVPFAFGETFERSATHGYTERLNALGGSGGGTGDIKSDGSVAFAANQSMGGHKLTTLQDGGTGTQEAASVAQVEALIAASTSNVADWKQSVRLATTAALAANTRVSNVLTANANGAMATIDGVAPAVGNRILVKDEVTGANRGIYTVTSLGSAGTPWVLTRATDSDTSAEVTCGLTCLVEEGTANAGKPFILTTANPITLNTTALTFSALSSATGDEVNIHSSAGVLSLIAGSVTNAQLAGSISWAKLLTAIGDVGFTGLKSLTYNGEVDNGNSGTSDAVDFTTGQLQKGTLTGNCTYTFTAPAGPCGVQLKLTQDGTGGRTVTLPTIVWLDGVTWQPNPTASSVSILPLYFDGTNYYGFGRALDSTVITESTTARTFGLTDSGGYVRTTNGSATTLTVPPNSSVAFAANTLISGIQAGAGQITFAQGAGVTINRPASRNLKTAEQYSSWALKKVATDVWDLCGDLEFA